MDLWTIGGVTLSATQLIAQLAATKDEDLVATLDVAAPRVREAANDIVNRAEAIFTKAAVCRLERDDDAHEVVVQIEGYFSNHPALTEMRSALDVVEAVCRELSERAKKKLQLPGAKAQKEASVATLRMQIDDVIAFAGELGAETRYLPARTGLALKDILTIENEMRKPSARNEDTVMEAIAQGRIAVQHARLRSLGAFEQTILKVRQAF